MTKMDRVGVIWMLVTFAEVLLDAGSLPIHLYVVPFTLIMPAQDTSDCTSIRQVRNL